jgi:hypothetical protein
VLQLLASRARFPWPPAGIGYPQAAIRLHRDAFTKAKRATAALACKIRYQLIFDDNRRVASKQKSSMLASKPSLVMR